MKGDKDDPFDIVDIAVKEYYEGMQQMQQATQAVPRTLIAFPPPTCEPYLVSWFSSHLGKYSYLRVQTDEAAIEKAQELMKDPAMIQVQILEMTHRWEREWNKKEER
jgi:hypothetical protein